MMELAQSQKHSDRINWIFRIHRMLFRKSCQSCESCQSCLKQHRHLVRLAFVGAPLLLALLSTLAFAQETLTLDQAITRALQHNRLIKNDEIEIAKAAERIEIARTRRLPEFEISALGLQPFTPLDFRFQRGSLGLLPGGTAFPTRDTTVGSGFTPRAFITARLATPHATAPRQPEHPTRNAQPTPG